MSSRIQWLKKHVETLEKQRAKLEADIAVLAKSIEIIEELEGVESQVVPPAKELRNAMWEILKEEGAPLHYREIYSRLRARRVDVPGKDPAKNVGAHLSNDDRFQSLGSGDWALASWNHPGHPPKRISDSNGFEESPNRDVVIPNTFEDDSIDLDDFDEVPF